MFFGYNNRKEAEQYWGDLSKIKPDTTKTLRVCTKSGCTGSLNSVFSYDDGTTDTGKDLYITTYRINGHKISF